MEMKESRAVGGQNDGDQVSGVAQVCIHNHLIPRLNLVLFINIVNILNIVQ